MENDKNMERNIQGGNGLAEMRVVEDCGIERITKLSRKKREENGVGKLKIKAELCSMYRNGEKSSKNPQKMTKIQMSTTIKIMRRGGWGRKGRKI